MEKKITRTNIAEHLLDYELAMIGKTRLDIVDDDRWTFHLTMTFSQSTQLKDYAIPLLQKTFRFNKSKAIDCFQWWKEQFGLRIKNN